MKHDLVVHIVVLANSTPKETLGLLGDYVHVVNKVRCLISPRFEYDHPFVKLEILPKDDNKARTVWIPVQFVLAVEALAAEDARQMGFRPRSKK